MSDTIFITGLVIHARHGVMDHETEVGQRFVIDLELSADLSESSRTDRLADTVSYSNVVATATAAFKDANYKLLERAAGAVAAAVAAGVAAVVAGRATEVMARLDAERIGKVGRHVQVGQGHGAEPGERLGPHGSARPARQHEGHARRAVAPPCPRECGPGVRLARWIGGQRHGRRPRGGELRRSDNIAAAMRP